MLKHIALLSTMGGVPVSQYTLSAQKPWLFALGQWTRSVTF